MISEIYFILYYVKFMIQIASIFRNKLLFTIFIISFDTNPAKFQLLFDHNFF